MSKEDKEFVEGQDGLLELGLVGPSAEEAEPVNDVATARSAALLQVKLMELRHRIEQAITVFELDTDERVSYVTLSRTDRPFTGYEYKEPFTKVHPKLIQRLEWVNVELAKKKEAA